MAGSRHGSRDRESDGKLARASSKGGSLLPPPPWLYYYPGWVGYRTTPHRTPGT